MFGNDGKNFSAGPPGNMSAAGAAPGEEFHTGFTSPGPALPHREANLGPLNLGRIGSFQGKFGRQAGAGIATGQHSEFSRLDFPLLVGIPDGQVALFQMQHY